MLFEFITKIGVFITYAVLKALLLDKFDNTSTQNNAIITLSRKQIVDLRNAWVHGTIQPERILWELWHAFNGPSLESSYEMNNKSLFQRLIEAFITLYPDIFNELEKLRKNMPGEIEGVLERRKH
jgi:hypothetical protein